MQGRDRLCSKEGRAAPAPHPRASPLRCPSKPRDAWAGKCHGIRHARLDHACKPRLRSKARQCLPSPSLGDHCGDCRWASPRRPAFITPLIGLGVALQSRVLAGHRLYRSPFSSLFDPSCCRGACVWLFACPKPRRCLPSQPSPTEPHPTLATEAPSQALSG